MTILITGATGFLGQQLTDSLLEAGHNLILATRQTSSDYLKTHGAFPGLIVTSPLSGNEPALKNVEAVIHLAGENLSSGRWTAERKKKIYNSRIAGTENLISIFPLLPKLRVFLSASAVGFYGSSEASTHSFDESAPSGKDFLSEVCRDWEAAAQKAARPDLRIVLLRTGVVLGRSGGVVKELEPVFRNHVAGPIGTGEQILSWIHEQDWVRATLFCLENESVSGPVNFVAPEPVTNRGFTEIMSEIFKGQIGIKTPGFLLKAALGEMSDIALKGQFVIPKKLMDAKFSFRFQTLREALHNLFDITESNRTPYQVFEARQWVPMPLEKAFQFFCDEKNLEKITPPQMRFQVVNKSTKDLGKGTLINYNLKIRGIPARWRTLIEEWNPPHSFTDEQLIGPYTKWHHRHTFKSAAGGTLMRDRVQYALPLGFAGRLAAGWFVKKDIDTIFDFRRQKIDELFGPT